MRTSTTGLLFLLIGAATGQIPSAAPPTIGYADTLLFNDSLRYSGFGYDGPAPLFVQAWFPQEPAPLGPALTFDGLRTRTLVGPLGKVHEALLNRMDSAFIAYDLRYPIGGDTAIDYDPFTEEQVKDILYSLPTHAHRRPLPHGTQRPVVVYHHGAQGMSDENVWMAEHFAGHGFLFLSCNFHWPLEGAMYGTPLVWRPDHHSIRTMLRFARALSGGGKVFYIGHSWGGQEGWCTLHEPGLADAFISLETTMEWKTNTAEVRDKWPQVLDAITRHRYPAPILMMADTDGAPPFPMFRGVNGDLRYLDPREPFAHESYTSAYFMRQAGEGRFHVPDRELLHQQADLYGLMLDELLAFLQEQAGVPSHRPSHPEGDPFLRATNRR